MTDSCEIHDKEMASYLCRHLAEYGREKALGFIESIEEDQYGWCQSCDQMYQKSGEWTELLLQKAQFKKVCGDCYSDCFWYQMDEAPHRVINDYQADHTDTEGLFDVADRFIDLANAEKKDIQHVSESFSYAAARYAAFEAVSCAKDAAKDKKVIIEFFSDRFKEMFVENLNDYMTRDKEDQD